MKPKEKKKKWLRRRHVIVRNILNLTLGVYTKLKCRVRVEKFRESRGKQYLILFNHQTAYDQFFVGMSFYGSVYYMASEDIFSNGLVSKLIRFLVAPIPIKKQTTDLKAILNCIRVAKEGGTIAIAPEGNRTYGGRTCYMSPSIVPLARKLGLPIALYRIEGGYGVYPRWSDVVRKGSMRAYVSRVVDPTEYATMTDDELFAVIRDELNVDEAVADGEFRHKKSAEYLERALYVCPDCGLTTLESHGDRITCLRCKRQVRYLPTKELEGVGAEFPFHFVADWYDYQSELVNRLDVTLHTKEPLYRETVTLSRVIPYKKKECIAREAELSLYGDRITLAYGGEEKAYSFDEISSVAVLGRNKLNVYHGGEINQIKGSKRFNALKYVHLYHRYLNLKKGDENGKFLGL